MTIERNDRRKRRTRDGVERSSAADMGASKELRRRGTARRGASFALGALVAAATIPLRGAAVLLAARRAGRSPCAGGRAVGNAAVLGRGGGQYHRVPTRSRGRPRAIGRSVTSICSAPVQSERIATVSLPSFRAGCGGIDAFAGAFSFIDSDQLVAFARGIAQNARGSRSIWRWKRSLRSLPRR